MITATREAALRLHQSTLLFFAQGTGSWDWVGTLIVSDNLADAPTFDETARLVMCNLELVALLESETAVIDKVVLAGAFAQREIVATLCELYPKIRFELRASTPANENAEYEQRERRTAGRVRW